MKGLARFIHISPLEERTEIDCLKAHIVTVGLEATVEDLRFATSIHQLQRQLSIGSQPLDPPPREDALKVSLHDYL